MEQFHIQEFYGIQQQTDGALLPVTSAADARNMDTSDGNLSVANGYAKHLATILPGTDKILKLIVAREATRKVVRCNGKQDIRICGCGNRQVGCNLHLFASANFNAD